MGKTSKVRIKPTRMWATFWRGEIGTVTKACQYDGIPDQVQHLRVVVLDSRDYAEMKRELKRLRSAIEWACGERGEFPVAAPLAGKYRRRYYWRTELRARAFGTAVKKGAGKR